MKIRTLLIVNSLVQLLFSLNMLFIPAQYLALTETRTDPTGLWLGELLGATAFSFALLSWFGRNVTDPTGQRAIVIASIGGWTLGFIIAFLGQLEGLGNALGWARVIVFGLFALAFAYYLFKQPERSEAPASA